MINSTDYNSIDNDTDNGVVYASSPLIKSMFKRKSDQLTSPISLPDKKACHQKPTVADLPPSTSDCLQAAAAAAGDHGVLEVCTEAAPLLSLHDLSTNTPCSPLSSPFPFNVMDSPCSTASVAPSVSQWLQSFHEFAIVDQKLALQYLPSILDRESIQYLRCHIEPYFRRDFIAQLPKELSLLILSYLPPLDLLNATQTCTRWRSISEDYILWREKCEEVGILSSYAVPTMPQRTSSHLHIYVPPFMAHSPYKAMFIRHSQVHANWTRRTLKDAQLLRGHDEHVITCLLFCGPDRVISGSDDNTLRIWDLRTNECIHVLIGHLGGVWCSQLTDSEDVVISGSTDRTLRVWDTSTGNCLHTLQGHTSTVRCLALKGNIIVSGSRDTTLRVWNIETGQCVKILQGHQSAVRSVQFDGTRVVSGAYDYFVKIWDVTSGQCLHTLSGHMNRVYSLQFDPIQNIVISGSLDTHIRVWDAATGECKHILTGHKSLNSDMQLKGNILVSGNADSTIRVWDVTTGRCLHVFNGPSKHDSAVTCLEFIDSGLVVTSSDDGTVKLWNATSGHFVRDLIRIRTGGQGGVVWKLLASRTKLICASGSRNGVEDTKLMVLDFSEDCLKD